MSTEPSTEAKAKPFISLWWALYAIFAIGYPLFSMLTERPPLPLLGQVDPFVLTKQDGEPYHYGNDDRPVVINFIFTRCPDVCPLLSAKMAEIQKRVPAEDALLISISVDPAYDQPNVLLEYGKQYDANFDRWFFLTGEESQVQKIIANFQVMYERIETNDNTPPNIAHSERFLLLDQFGEIRGIYDDDPHGLNQLITAIDQL